MLAWFWHLGTKSMLAGFWHLGTKATLVELKVRKHFFCMKEMQYGINNIISYNCPRYLEKNWTFFSSCTTLDISSKYRFNYNTNPISKQEQTSLKDGSDVQTKTSRVHTLNFFAHFLNPHSTKLIEIFGIIVPEIPSCISLKAFVYDIPTVWLSFLMWLCCCSTFFI